MQGPPSSARSPPRPALVAATLLVAAVVLAPARAEAQCAPGPFNVYEYMRLGPTAQVLGALPVTADGLPPSVLLRFGILAGLPVQFEVSYLWGLATTAAASFGTRLLPLGLSPSRGLVLGGSEGLSVGGLGGFTSAGGWYAGATAEYLFVPEFGLTAEYVIIGGGALGSPPSFNVGVKGQLPWNSTLTGGGG